MALPLSVCLMGNSLETKWHCSSRWKLPDHKEAWRRLLLGRALAPRPGRRAERCSKSLPPRLGSAVSHCCLSRCHGYNLPAVEDLLPFLSKQSPTRKRTRRPREEWRKRPMRRPPTAQSCSPRAWRGRRSCGSIYTYGNRVSEGAIAGNKVTNGSAMGPLRSNTW